MEQRIRFIQNKEGKRGIEVCLAGTVYRSGAPVEIEVKEADGGFRLYRSGYEKVEETKNGYRCLAMVETAYGSQIAVVDNYQEGEGISDAADTCQQGEKEGDFGVCQPPEEAVVFIRKVQVVRENGREVGFSSSFALQEEGKNELDDYEVFIPGIWYRRNENVVNKAFGSSLRERYYYIRITRMAMPYVELYRPGNGSYIVMKHISPSPSTGMKEISADWIMDASFQYASMGIRNEGAAELVYNFPGNEGEKTYIDEKQAWAKRSHPLRKGFVQEYSFSLTGGKARGHYEAMGKVWRHFYETSTPEHKKADMKKVYQHSMELLNVYTQKYNGVMGLPFWTTVPEGTVCDISFQMGFVGQQTMCAYQLMRYGYQYDQKEMVEKASAIIDFWVKESMRDSVIPRVWYNAFPDTFKADYPTYTRTVSDGMEGILASYLCAAREGRIESSWLDFCISYADWLVRKQNADGSFYRAYDEKGYPVHKGKFNTTNVVRFLVNMYWATEKERYKEAACKAGQFSYDNIYLPMQYVGGTADNDNTIDKEAGMIAVYAFMALYDLDGRQCWLEAAKGAADFTETWTYVWNYEVKPYKGNAVFDKVDITGLSLIATGHSHADVMMGYMSYEYYRLYLYTSDGHYRDFALFLNGNTKQTMDWSGRLGHVYPGLVEESGELAMQYHNGLGRWLPWCTVAQIESLTRFQERFGSMDVEEIDQRMKEINETDNCKRGYSWLGM